MKNKDLDDLLDSFDLTLEDDSEFDGSDDAFIHFKSRRGNLKMTVVGDPRDATTMAAQQCVEIYSKYLETTGVKREDENQFDLEFVDTEGNA